MTGLIARCPAKINLGLTVLRKRSDGYHDLVTLFQAIGLEDVLHGEPAESLTLECDDRRLPVDDGNLVIRAAHALREARPRRAHPGARLRLTKRIPVGGGLGGGSSDAAGAILLLDRLWGLGLRPGERAGIAASLGSDVAFFLQGGLALGTGRGEILEPLSPIPERPVVLGLPPFGLSTAEVFASLAAPLTPRQPAVSLSRFYVKSAEGNDFARATNDLESSAFALRPELATFRDALLRSGAELALLSGSGSSVFGLFRERDAAVAAASSAAEVVRGWSVVTTSTVARGARIE